LTLVELATQMVKTRIEYFEKFNPLTWVVLANLGLASTSDLFALKIPFKKTEN